MKFKVNSKNFLFEAFSSSMPKWLQNYIMYNNRGKQLSSTALPEFSKFTGARFRDTGRERGNVAIEVMDGSTGIKLDFSRATFFNQPLPSKIDDPIFEDPSKMCFVHLKSDNDETVWIPRFSNSKERFILDDGKAKTLDKLNTKLLNTYGKDFCYIDLLDENNFANELVQRRKLDKQGTQEYTRYEKSPVWNRKIDKSGYIIIPPVIRYADKLKELKIKKLPEYLIEVRNNLLQLQQDINRLQTDYITKESSDENRNSLFYDMANASNYFQTSLHQLKTALKHINELDKIEDKSSISKYTVERIKEDLDKIKTSIEEAYKYIGTYIPSTIDWNEDDDSIYVDVEDDFE